MQNSFEVPSIELLLLELELEVPSLGGEICRFSLIFCNNDQNNDTSE